MSKISKVMFWDACTWMLDSVICPFMWPVSISLWENSTICWSVHPLMDSWVIFSLGFLWIKSLWIFVCTSSCDLFSLLLGLAFLTHEVTIYLMSYETTTLFPKVILPLALLEWEHTIFSTKGNVGEILQIVREKGMTSGDRPLLVYKLLYVKMNGSNYSIFKIK